MEEYMLRLQEWGSGGGGWGREEWGKLFIVWGVPSWIRHEKNSTNSLCIPVSETKGMHACACASGEWSGEIRWGVGGERGGTQVAEAIE